MSDSVTLGEVLRTLLVDPDLPPPDAAGDETRPLRETAAIDPSAGLAWTPRRADPSGLADLTYREFHLSGLGCGYSAFAGLVKTFAAQFGAPYDSFPFHLLLNRRGRYSGGGKICGAVLGSGAVFKMFRGLKEGEELTEELRAWYAAAPMPAYVPTPAVVAGANGLGREIPRSAAGSARCSDSQVNWVRACDFKVQETDKRERCGRLTADVAVKAMELLNGRL